MNAIQFDSLKKLSNSEKVSKVLRWWQYSSDWRKKQEWQWHVNKNFQHGQHYEYWNINTRRLEARPNPYKRVRATVNKVREKSRAMANFILKRRPKWVVSSVGVDDYWVKNARNIGKILDVLWDEKKISLIAIEAFLESLDTSAAPTEILWDYELNDGLGDIKITNLSSFWLYPDPLAGGDYQDGRFSIKVTRVPITDIHTNPRYDPKQRVKVSSDSKISVSEWEETYQHNIHGPQTTGEKGLETSMVYEAYVRVYVDTQKERANPQTGEAETVNYRKTRIVKITIAGGRVMEFKLTKLTLFPYAILRSDINSKEAYGETRVKEMIGPQKVYNKLTSLILEHLNLFRGKVIADKGSGIKIIPNEAGIVLEKNPGKNVVDAPPQQLGASIFKQKEDTIRDLDGLSGIYAQFAGYAPFAAESGKHAQTMQAGSANNLADLLLMFEIYLKDFAELVLWNMANYAQTSQLVQIIGNEGKEEFMNVIGGETAIGKEKTGQMLDPNSPKEEGPTTVIIPAKNKVRVDISSWMSWSEEEKLTELKELFRYGIIDDPQTVLEQLRVGNLADILERAEKKRVKEQVAQQRMMAQQQGIEPGKKTNEIEIAEFENLMMTQGRDVPPTSDKAPITQSHTMIHTEYSGSNQFQSASPEIKEQFARHVEGEDKYHSERRTAT